MANVQPYARIPGAELGTWVEKADFALLPLASIEWHGPHLPLGTDLVLSDTFATTLEGEFTCVLFPTVAYSACPGKTQAYHGTISIRPEIALAYLCDVLDGILRTGFQRVLLLNAHDANMSLARAAMEWVTGRHLSSLLLANWWQMVNAADLQRSFDLDYGGRGHGGPYETSVTWSFAPDAVAAQARIDLPPRPNLDVEFQHVRVESRPDPWDGYAGLVSRASPDKGAALAAQARKNLARLIRAWLEAPLPGPPPPPGSAQQAAPGDVRQ